MPTGKGIAILGGTGGFGEAVIRRITPNIPVTIGYTNSRDKANKLVEEVGNAGGEAEAIQVNMEDDKSAGEFFERASQRWDGLRGIVSVTGPMIPICHLTDVSEEEFKRIYDADVLGAFHVLKHGSKQLKKVGGGSIVMCLTTAVLRTIELDGMSGCPKTAVMGMIKQVAREHGPDNVRCNGLAPGVFDTGIVHKLFPKDEKAKEIFSQAVDATPLRRMGEADELASLVEYLISEDASYISGQIIGIDGGLSA